MIKGSVGLYLLQNFAINYPQIYTISSVLLENQTLLVKKLNVAVTETNQFRGNTDRYRAGDTLPCDCNSLLRNGIVVDQYVSAVGVGENMGSCQF